MKHWLVGLALSVPKVRHNRHQVIVHIFCICIQTACFPKRPCHPISCFFLLSGLLCSCKPGPAHSQAQATSTGHCKAGPVAALCPAHSRCSVSLLMYQMLPAEEDSSREVVLTQAERGPRASSFQHPTGTVLPQRGSRTISRHECISLLGQYHDNLFTQYH